MDATRSLAQQRRISAVGTLVGLFGLAIAVFSLALSFGAVSSQGPILFLIGAVGAVLGMAVRFDARRKLYDHQFTDPRYRASH